MSAIGGKADIIPVLRSEDRIDHLSDGVSRCRKLIAVAISQIDGDPIVGDRLVDSALEITVAHFKKIIALQRAGRRNPMTHENAEDLTANILVGRSVKHGSTIGSLAICDWLASGLVRPADHANVADALCPEHVAVRLADLFRWKRALDDFPAAFSPV